MKDRLVFSPKQARIPQRYDVNFKKSPIKYAMYDLPLQMRNQPINDPHLLASTSHQFDNLKKVTEETAALRQTMNNKVFARLQRNHTIELQDEGKNKLNDFLRQTMGSSKSNRVYSDTLIPDNAYSGDTYDRAIGGQDRNKNNKYFETYRIQQRKGMDMLNDTSSLREYEKLSEKINRNKQMIDQLRSNNKDTREGKDLLKNVNHHRSPTFLHIDYGKQKEETLQFAKKASKKDDPNFFLTPKIDKGNYQGRFNSSPLIEKAKSSQKKPEEPAISSFSTISSVKKKTSMVSNKCIQVDDFIVDKKLGEGKFGCVNLVKHKRTNAVFALKKIPKSLIKSNMMVDQLSLEIRIQSCLKHANILEMYGCFDDKTHLYIVLEYMDGGTLYQRIKKQKINQKQTAIIIRQVTAAIDYLHDLGIAHRDVKPENVVISNSVYKLCDFGWAAICNQRRKTYCGTFDYVAPEILQGVQYDMTVDLWCLGVLTYELLTGKAPFYHISRKETMKKILNVENENITFPESMSEDARDFIDKLIRKDPTQRIRANEALLHPFLIVEDEFS